MENIEPLCRMVAHATHLLPTQGPIKVFVHHNTLHAFEDRSFDKGVLLGLEVFGCEPYFSEQRYREEVQRGRIQIQDLEAVLVEDLDDEADRLVASFGTRYALRLAMLRFPISNLPERELQWMLTESDALLDFRDEVDESIVENLVAQTRKLISQHNIRSSPSLNGWLSISDYEDELQTFDLRKSDRWSEATWKTFTLHLLWRTCRDNVRRLDPQRRFNDRPVPAMKRPRELLLKAVGVDSDSLVNEVLIRFCAVYLDQGFAAWELADREQGLFKTFVDLYSTPMAILPAWMQGIDRVFRQLRAQGTDAVSSIAESLAMLGVAEVERESFIESSLLALRGWAGMIWQMETNAPWIPWPLPTGSLLEFLAIRLILDRFAIAHIARRWLDEHDLRAVRAAAERRILLHERRRNDCAFTIFQIAQARGWSPGQLHHLNTLQWEQLVREIADFGPLERRRIMHLAYERRYRNAALDAISVHSTRRKLRRALESDRLDSIGTKVAVRRSTPAFQVITCIDDREESFRRHLEEVCPECETFGAAGFFAVIMYYQGAAEAHYRPLCPINVVPKHWVREEAVFSAVDEDERRSQRRRWIGQVSRQVHAGSRTIVGGLVTGVLGSLATFPLVARVLAPRITSRIRDSIGGFVRPPSTELHLQREAPVPGQDPESLGFSISEMAGIVVRILQDIGLVRDFSPIVLFLGHGSSSLNNPHESAYNCGACSGGRGGPNARAFAWMANDNRVRKLVADNGIDIPDNVRFVGGYHNTCNDRVEYYDLDQLPHSHRRLFREMEASIAEARCRNALERTRRFESAPLNLSASEALEHVEERAEDLSQARPEYNHATNALCLVGQREWSRGLFLDRRAFLASYDPNIDDAEGKIVERILQAAIPVCGGISLEYFFSTVDPEGHGCGSKLPHNISSLAGVMTGAASDLRPGLSAQMVEIHEPMRILFVVQTNPTVMSRIIAANPPIQQLVEHEWVQLALLDASNSNILLYRRGQFERYIPVSQELPIIKSSADWFQGNRDHLGFATIVESVTMRKTSNDRSPTTGTVGETK